MFKKQRIIFDKLPFDVVDSNIEDPSSLGERYVQVGPKKYIQLSIYKEYGLDIYNFEARSDDVYLIGYPRSGTTLHSELIWLIGNQLNYEEAKKSYIGNRFPHIDLDLLRVFDQVKKQAQEKNLSEDAKEIPMKYDDVNLKGLTERKCRRFLKSHLPISLMPPHIFEVGAKVIYCARNPKDMLVSLYNVIFYFQPHMDKTKYTFREYFERHKNNMAWYGPYFEHLKEAWARRNDENFLFIFYEDTLKNKRETIEKISNFLGKKLTESELERLEEHSSFEAFKKNKYVNGDQFVKLGTANKHQKFIRQGKAGTWRDYFEGDLEKEVDEWIENNLEGTDIYFPNA